MAVSNAVTLEDKKAQSAIAMVVALVSWGMLFAGLFLSYAVYRFQQPMWPPIGMDTISLMFPIMSTLFAALSSLLFEVSRRTYAEKNVNKSRNYFRLTFLMGLCFLVSQYQVWNNLNAIGVMVDTGVYASILHGFTWIHAAHIVCAMIGVFYLCIVTKKEFINERLITIDNIGKFWHFLGAIWFIMFVILFVV